MGLVLLVDRLFIAEFDRCVIAYNRTINNGATHLIPTTFYREYDYDEPN